MELKARLIIGGYIDCSVSIGSATFDLGLLDRNEAERLLSEIEDMKEELKEELRRMK